MPGTPGTLEVGTTGKGEVVVNHSQMDVDVEGRGYIIFSPEQAKMFASVLISKAVDAEIEREAMAPTILNVTDTESDGPEA